MDLVTKYFTLLCSVNSFLVVFASLLHFSNGRWSIAPLQHRLQTALQVVLEAANQLVLVQGHDAANPKQKQHKGLDWNGSPDNATKETMTADQNPRVQVVIAAL